MMRPSGWSGLRRHHRREIWILGLIALLFVLPWLAGLATGIWFIARQGWGWHWWVGSVLLITLAFWLLRSQLPRNRRPPINLPGAAPGASEAEQQARQALQQYAKALDADDPPCVNLGPEAVQCLIEGAFHAVAQAYSPDDRAALWRFTLPELLLMVEDFSRRLRETLLRDFPVVRHVELAWVIHLLGLRGPTRQLMSLWRQLRWANPSDALLGELRRMLSHQAFEGIGDSLKAQIRAMLVEQAGETAIRLYSGGYRRRADELLPTAPRTVPDTPAGPLTVLLAGRRNAGKSALLNALLGETREPVGLLTAPTGGCRAYAFASMHAGQLVLVDCPGTDGTPNEPWLRQASKSDLVLWVAAANRADRALDQRALAALDAFSELNPTARPIPRVLVLTHADLLDPPREWALPYDPEQGQGRKEQEMRAAREAACEQLAMPLQQTALIAIRPGEPVWNHEALEKAILNALPEAKQKQLERGLAPDGWFRRLTDTLRTLPSTYGEGRSILVRTVRSTAGKLLGKNRPSGSPPDAH